MPDLLPPAVQAFAVDAAAYIAGIDEMIAANARLAESIAATASAAKSVSADAAGLGGVAAGGAVTAGDAAAAGEAAAEQGKLSAAEKAAADAASFEAEMNRTLAETDAMLVSANDAVTESLGVQAAAMRTTSAANAEVSGSSLMLGARFAQLGTATIATAAVFTGYGLKSAADYQQQILRLGTSAGETGDLLGGKFTGNLKLVSDGILKLAVETGTSTQQLTSGMYMVESAGFHGAQGLNVLKAAAEGARAEGAQLGDVANALTSILNSYGTRAGTATQATNQMVAAVGAGKMTMQDFSSSLSAVLPVAAAAGISFPQVAGAIATMTAQGMSAQQATQNLANTIRTLQNPNAQAIQEMGQLGISSVQLGKDLGKQGLTGTFNEITQAILQHMGPAGLTLLNAFHQSQFAAQDANTMIKAMPPSLAKLAQAYLNGSLTVQQWKTDVKALPTSLDAQATQFATVANQALGFNNALKTGGPAARTYTGELAKVVGNSTALNTILLTTGSHMPAFSANVQSIANSAKSAGSNVNGWAKIQQSFNFQLSQAKEAAETLAIKLGMALIPMIETLMKWASQHIGLVETLAGLAGVVLALAAAWKIITVVQAAWNAVMAITNAVMAADPIVLIVAALAALAIGLYEAYQHSKTFRDIVQAVFKAVGDAAKAVGQAGLWLWQNALKPAFDGISTAVQAAWNDVLHPVFNAIGVAAKAVGDASMWLWRNAVKPAMDGIGAAVKLVWNDIIHPIFGLWMAEARLVAAVVMWLWRNVVEPAMQGVGAAVSLLFNDIIAPVFNLWMAVMRLMAALVLWWWRTVWEPALKGIAQAIQWLYTTVVQPIFNLWMAAMRTVANVATWLWHTVFDPVMHGIGTTISWLYNSVAKPNFDMLMQAMRDVASIVQWLYNNVIQPTFSAIGNTISWVWNNVIEPVFNAIRTAVQDVANSVVGAMNTIRNAINSVSGGVNAVAHALGFAHGGPVPGPPGEPLFAVLHGGEYVLSQDMLMGRQRLHGIQTTSPPAAVAEANAVGGADPGMSGPVYAGGTVGQPIVHVEVHGNVWQTEQLVGAMQQGLLKYWRRNGNSGLFPRSI